MGGSDVTILRFALLSVACAVLTASGCAKPVKVTKIAPGDDAQKRAQTALIDAKPGDVIEFGEGTFKFPSTRSPGTSGVTPRGRGQDKTILSFEQQGQGTGG